MAMPTATATAMATAMATATADAMGTAVRAFKDDLINMQRIVDEVRAQRPAETLVGGLFDQLTAVTAQMSANTALVQDARLKFDGTTGNCENRCSAQMFSDEVSLD